MRRLRATRANPPGLAFADDDRRATYAAAVQQHDDLLAAARTVGPLSRPLPLYYAVHQAGKAIAAAWTGPDDWHVRGHGLAEDTSDRTSWQTDVQRFRVKPAGVGVFGAVARTLGSAGLTGSVEMGALWSALPDVPVPPDVGRWRLAMRVIPPPYFDSVDVTVIGPGGISICAIKPTGRTCRPLGSCSRTIRTPPESRYDAGMGAVPT